MHSYEYTSRHGYPKNKLKPHAYVRDLHREGVILKPRRTYFTKKNSIRKSYSFLSLFSPFFRIDLYFLLFYGMEFGVLACIVSFFFLLPAC